MSHKSTFRYGLAAMVAFVGMLVSGGSAASTTGPTVRGVSECTEQAPFAVRGVVTGLEPNTVYGVDALFSTGGSAGTVFTTDGTGAAGFGSTLATSPFEVRIVIWLNPDGDFDQDPGEPIIIDQTFVVDRPCEDARPKLPTSKDECNHSGWETYGVFKNQGDCVSFVATGGKNPPASSP